MIDVLIESFFFFCYKLSFSQNPDFLWEFMSFNKLFSKSKRKCFDNAEVLLKSKASVFPSGVRHKITFQNSQLKQICIFQNGNKKKKVKI